VTTTGGSTALSDDHPAITLENLSMVFGEGREAVRALDDVSLHIHANEFFTLLGPSGCGKTTLLRLIAGFEQPTSGSVRLYGSRLEGLPPYKRPVNTVFQSYALFPHMTVAQNVAFGLEESRKPRSEITRTVADMLNLVRLEGYANRKPSQLSGGQQQRVALARALANHPKVLLLDESLSALDLKLRQEMRLELKRIQSETGITFVFVTHDQDEALTMSDRVAVMRSGRVEQIGTPTEIYDHPRNRYVADFIGDTNFLEGRVSRNAVLLESGSEITVWHGVPEGSLVTLAVRPERARLARDGDGLPARVTQIVYMGTDTLYHLMLGGTAFKVRVTNTSGATRDFSVGEDVRITIPPDAIQVLEDTDSAPLREVVTS
jgi:spermidine/putrescine transport system ATP-binding protein